MFKTWQIATNTDERETQCSNAITEIDLICS